MRRRNHKSEMISDEYTSIILPLLKQDGAIKTRIQPVFI